MSATPDVQRLVDRLAVIPRPFLRPVEPTEPSPANVEAVVADLFRDRAGRPLTSRERRGFVYPRRGKAARRAAMRTYLRVVLVACWLLHDEAFDGVDAEALLGLTGERLRALSELVAPLAFVEDPDRREELVRTCLHALGIAPSGETEADAEDRLSSLDSVRRMRLLERAREREREREEQRKKLEELRRQEEEARRQAARTTFED